MKGAWRRSLAVARLGQLRCFDALGAFEDQLNESQAFCRFIDDNGGVNFGSAFSNTGGPSGLSVSGGGGGGVDGGSVVPSSAFSSDHREARAWLAEARRLGHSAACSLQRWDVLQADKDLTALAGDGGGGAGGSGRRLRNRGDFDDDGSGGVQPYMYAAMLALRVKDFDGADRCIGAARKRLAPVLGGMLDEAYSRAYGSMVTVQQLAELEEIVFFRRKEGELRRLHTPALAEAHIADAKARLREKWRKRLHNLVAPDISVWRRLVQVRSLVLPPWSDEGTWLRLAGLCRRSGHLTLCEQTLRRLQVSPHAPPEFITGADGLVRLLADDTASAVTAAGGGGVLPRADAATVTQVALRPSAAATVALFEYMWASGQRTDAMQRLGRFTDELLKQWDAAALATAETGLARPGPVRTELPPSPLATAPRRASHIEEQGSGWAAGVLRASRRGSSGIGSGASAVNGLSAQQLNPLAMTGLLVKSLLKLAEWKRLDVSRGLAPPSSAAVATAALSSPAGGGGGGSSDVVVVESLGLVLDLLEKAKARAPGLYRAWHAWALTNHEIVNLAQQRHRREGCDRVALCHL